MQNVMAPMWHFSGNPAILFVAKDSPKDPCSYPEGD